MGFGTDGPDNGPWNMSFPMVPPFQILGPSKNPYPGTVCLPQVPLPANTTVKAGDNATIQVVELAVHGASLFSVSFCPAPPVCPCFPPPVADLKPFLVRRHHLCRARRRAPRGRQRDKLLQQQRHWLRGRLHHRHPRGRRRPHRATHLGRRRRRRDALLVLWPPRRPRRRVRLEHRRPRARRAGHGLGALLSGGGAPFVALGGSPRGWVVAFFSLLGNRAFLGRRWDWDWI